jgi:hypothetical protein
VLVDERGLTKTKVDLYSFGSPVLLALAAPSLPPHDASQKLILISQSFRLEVGRGLRCTACHRAPRHDVGLLVLGDADA